MHLSSGNKGKTHPEWNVSTFVLPSLTSGHYSQLLSVAFVQNPSSDMLSLYHNKQKLVSCCLPHTSLISPLDMLEGHKSLGFSSAGIGPVTTTLFPYGSLSLIAAVSCQRLWSSSEVEKALSFFLSFSSRCLDRLKISLAVKINKVFHFKVFSWKSHVEEKQVLSLK